MKSKLIFIGKILLVTGIFAYLFNEGQLDPKSLLLFQDNPFWFIVIALGFVLVIIPLLTLRWLLLLKPIGSKATFLNILQLTWIGNFFNMIIPGSVSGDLIKAIYLLRAENQLSKTRLMVTLLIDRFIGLFGLLFLAFFGVINYWFYSQDKSSDLLLQMSPVLLMFVLMIVGMIIIFLPPASEKYIRAIITRLPKQDFFLQIYEAFRAYRDKPISLLASLMISIIIQLIVCMFFLIIFSLFGLTLSPIGTHFIILAIGFILLAIPIAPGGIGVGHVAFQALYATVGITKGADVFNLYIIVQFLVFLLGSGSLSLL